MRLVHTALSWPGSEGHTEMKGSGTLYRLSLKRCAAVQEKQQAVSSQGNGQGQGIASGRAINIMEILSMSHLRRWRIRRQAVAEWMTWNSRLGLASQGRGLYPSSMATRSSSR